MNMLTQDDLKAIGTLIEVKLDEKVPAIVEKAVCVALERWGNWFDDRHDKRYVRQSIQ